MHSWLSNNRTTPLKLTSKHNNWPLTNCLRLFLSTAYLTHRDSARFFLFLKSELGLPEEHRTIYKNTSCTTAPGYRLMKLNDECSVAGTRQGGFLTRCSRLISSCLNLRIASACSCSNSSCCLRSATSRICWPGRKDTFFKRQRHRSHVARGLGRRVVLPLGPALGSPVWHGVSGSPRELNCVERSLQRDLPSAPHSQPESGRAATAETTTNKGYEWSCAWWRKIRSSTPTWSSSCAFLLRRSASSFSCSFLPRSSSSWLSCSPPPKTKRHWSDQSRGFPPSALGVIVTACHYSDLNPDWSNAREHA